MPLTRLVVLGLSLLVTLTLVALPRPASVRAFQGTMVLFIVSGFVGLFLHYRGNAEFELEMYPSLAGFGLFWEALRGATPTLAPAAMTFLGVVGLAFAYRYPDLRRSKTIKDDQDNQGQSQTTEGGAIARS